MNTGVGRVTIGGVTALAVLMLLGPTVVGGAHGAGRADAPIVLTVTMGGNLAPTPPARIFAGAVFRLSRGQMTISFQPASGGLTVENERLALQAVREGSTHMGWIPTRVWDTQGVKTFTALQAPFLITDYALLKRVLVGPVGRGMASGTRSRGVRTLGIVADDRRLPLGARKPFVARADFQGAGLRIPAGSQVTRAILEALGATGVEIASGTDLSAALRDGTVDGAETGLGYVLSNGYYRVARYLTTNLIFFMRTDAISINERAFQALTSAQRSILVRAAREAVERSFNGLTARDQEQVRLLCLAGLKLASSTRTQLAALMRAERPVYAMLRRHRPTAIRVAQIQALKRTTRPSPPVRVPQGCAP